MKPFLIKTHLALLSVIAFADGAVAQPMTDYTGPVFPPNHALNTPIDNLPVHPNSKNFISSIGENTALHPDFGNYWDDDGTPRQMGIPYNVVGAGQPLVPITFVSYPEESDPGPWPIPRNPYIETVFDWRDTEGGDRHMLIVDSSTHILYEITGREVVTLLHEYLNEGMQMIEWNGQDSQGQSTATGTYVCQLLHQDGSSDFLKIMRF